MIAFPTIFGADPEPIVPGRVVSLLDMLKAYAARFFYIGHALEEMLAGVKADKSLTTPISETEEVELSELCHQLRAACGELDMGMTVSAIDRFRSGNSLPTSRLELTMRLAEIRQRAIDELASKAFLHLTTEQASLLNAQYPIGRDAEERFPEISADLSEGAKCLAFGRYTAAVFHLTRVIECGLNQFVKLTKATVTATMTWGQKLNAIDTMIQAMPNKTPAQLKKKRAMARVYEAFDSIKEAWRNPVAHDLGVMNTPDDARNLMDRTKQVFNALLSLYPKKAKRAAPIDLSDPFDLT